MILKIANLFAKANFSKSLNNKKQDFQGVNDSWFGSQVPMYTTYSITPRLIYTHDIDIY